MYKRWVYHNAVTQLIQTEATDERIPEHRIKLYMVIIYKFHHYWFLIFNYSFSVQDSNPGLLIVNSAFFPRPLNPPDDGPAKIEKVSPYSITERRVPELIPVLGSQPAGDVNHKPDGRLPVLSARPAVTPCYQFCCLVNRGTMGVNSLSN